MSKLNPLAEGIKKELKLVSISRRLVLLPESSMSPVLRQGNYLVVIPKAPFSGILLQGCGTQTSYYPTQTVLAFPKDAGKLP
ncbi:MAG: hypothetical protein MUC50_08325, partial [Myxococcota bacterium]|nr:hypothetical protein [Myxococcota bacterium]